MDQVNDFNDNYNDGWIKLFRSIEKHWIWNDKPFTKGQAWIDILIQCNHSEHKVNLGNIIIICKRGESLNSLETWAKRWGWHKSKVRRFIKLLESDSMLVQKPTQQSTHLKVLNYSVYQDIATQQVKLKRNASETLATPNNNDKNEKNKKIISIRHKYGEYKNVLLTDKQYEKLYEDFNSRADLLIKKLDEGIQLKGYKYKDHNLAIRKWAEKENIFSAQNKTISINPVTGKPNPYMGEI